MGKPVLTAKFRIIALAGIVAVVALLSSQLTACASPAYYWQAASGHLALMHARQPVDETIERGDADEDVIEKLRLSRQIKAFAVSELGLPDNDSYNDFVRTGKDAVVWNVVAAPEFSLAAKTWCFPVSGCVPYRGYFKQANAEEFAGKLQRQDLDVAISPAIAYSTLGWFKDPLLDTMWRHSDTQFAAYLFHELAHQALYVKDDAMFNESYASFVEDVGVELWLIANQDPEALQRWLDLSEARVDFNNLLQHGRKDLEQVYQSSLEPVTKRAEKQAAFVRVTEAYSAMRVNEWGGRDYFGSWFDKPLNNARFALVDTYEGGSCAFESLFAQADRDILRFHELARAKSELPADERRIWLEQPCSAPEIAPAGEL